MQVPARLGLPLACALLVGSAASAQTVTRTGTSTVSLRRPVTLFQTLVQEGDVIGGVGTVNTVSNFAVNDKGEWIVEAATNASSEANDVLVKNGSLFLREGDLLRSPSGAGINTFDTVNLNDDGDSGWNLFLENTTGTGDDSGMYFNDVLLIQEGDFSSAPELSASTPYIGFFEAKINDSSELVFIASVDDPAISSTVDQVLTRLATDGSGNVTSESVIAKEGDLLAGQSETVATFGTSPHTFALNANGDVMFVVDLNGSTATDVAVYLNGSVVAQEGSASPAAGRNWSLGTSTTSVDVNDAGSWVVKGGLDGDTASNTLIAVDGVKFVQEGDSIPAIAPFTFTSFGTGPVQLANDGTVLWYGEWNDPDADVNSALFLDDRILVQEGVTKLGGVTVDTLRGIQDGYTMSDDGRFVVFEAVLVGSIEGAYMATRPTIPAALTAAPEEAPSLTPVSTRTTLELGPASAGLAYAVASGVRGEDGLVSAWTLERFGVLDGEGGARLETGPLHEAPGAFRRVLVLDPSGVRAFELDG